MKSVKTRLLIVDDSAIIQRLLKKAILKIFSEGLVKCIRITQAFNCDEARSLFKCSKPEIVILDISLPDGSGLTLLDEFRKSERIQGDDKHSPPAIIVILTNHVSPEIKDRCLAAGANEFFDKNDIYVLLDYLSTVKFNKVNSPYNHN